GVALRGLAVTARARGRRLPAPLASTNRAVDDFDRELVDKLPALVAKLDSTLTRLDAAAGGADAVINENRAAIRSFTNDGLAQLAPTLAEMQALIRDLRQISEGLQGGPAAYLMGRSAPKEF